MAVSSEFRCWVWGEFFRGSAKITGRLSGSHSEKHHRIMGYVYPASFFGSTSPSSSHTEQSLWVVCNKGLQSTAEAQQLEIGSGFGLRFPTDEK